jgi:hypothetical protein
MKRGRVQMKDSVLAMLSVIALLSVMMIIVTGFMVPAYADESISISCYNEAKSSWPVGRVEVFDVAQAAQACNSLYYDCKGRCIGCYQDSDYLDNVCVDMWGNTFLK